MNKGHSKDLTNFNALVFMALLEKIIFQSIELLLRDKVIIFRDNRKFTLLILKNYCRYKMARITQKDAKNTLSS